MGAVPIIVTAHGAGIRAGVVSDSPVEARETAAHGAADALLTAIAIQIADGKSGRTDIEATRSLDVVRAVTLNFRATIARTGADVKTDASMRSPPTFGGSAAYT